jgi:hypothetical protein
MRGNKLHFRQFGLIVCLGIVWILVAACSPSSEKLEFRKNILKTKNEYHSLDFRDAVMSLYEKYNHYDSDRDRIPTSEIPKVISSLPIFLGTPSDDIYARALDANKLMFSAGGGFGSWGIIVCKDEKDKSVAKAYGSEVQLWENGIYFYRQ